MLSKIAAVILSVIGFLSYVPLLFYIATESFPIFIIVAVSIVALYEILLHFGKKASKKKNMPIYLLAIAIFVMIGFFLSFLFKDLIVHAIHSALFPPHDCGNISHRIE